MTTPWTRINDYMNLLSLLQLHTPKEHADQDNIHRVSVAVREIYLYIKQVTYKTTASEFTDG
jgi:hypothetical protein